MTRTRTLSRRFIGAASTLVLAAGLAFSASLAVPARADQAITAERLSNGAPMSFADLIERVSPAVVSVSVVTEIETPFGRNEFNFDDAPDGFEDFFRQFRRQFDEEDSAPREGRALGSGFIISAEGHIVTNNHVVDNATSVMIALKDGEEYEAEVLGVDESTDLAVLKISGDEPFAFVEFAEGPPLRVGDWVVAVGNPFGLGGTATAGIISATGREIGGRYNDFIQIDAPINRGNSGGPTFDLNGHVVGVNSQIYSPSGGNVGIGFAIPAETAQRIVTALIEDGRIVRGWLGVTIQSVNEDIAESLGLDDAHGAIVSNVVDGGPAEKAGFEEGDVVLEVNGETVESNVDLTRKVGSLVVDERVRFRVLRDGRERNLRVTIGERPTDEVLAGFSPSSEPTTPESRESEEFGLTLSRLDDEDRNRLSLDDRDQGVLIKDLSRDGEAAEKGLRPGEAILEVGGEEIVSASDFDAAVEDARSSGRSAVLLLVQNEQGRRFVALSLTENG